MVSPEDKPIFITLAISSMIVCVMCPVMSFIATCLFMHPGNQIIALWLQKTVQNFPHGAVLADLFRRPRSAECLWVCCREKWQKTRKMRNSVRNKTDY